MQINDFFSLLVMAAVILIASGIGALIAEQSAVYFSKIIAKINYKIANFAVGIILIAMVSLLCGAFGLLIFATASAIGLFAASAGINRSSAMAVLIFPVLTFYFGI